MESHERVARSILDAARRLVDTFAGGGRLICHGEAHCRTDAAHIVVEFLHPVITGKPALAAMAGSTSLRPTDIVLSVAYDGAPVATEADIVLTDTASGIRHSGAPPPTTIVVPTDRALGTAHAVVVAYHVLWETVQAILSGAPASGVGHASEALYPMLYQSSEAADAGTRVDEPLMQSAVAKIAESAQVTRQALSDNAGRLETMAAALRTAPTVFACGNGGSSTDADRLAGLFGHRGYSLSQDIATVTALANDVAFDVVFARPLATLAQPGDALVGFSTSGGSANVLRALRQGARMGLTTFGLAGYGGGPMRDLELDALLVVNSDSVHRIQEAQVVLAEQTARIANS